MIITNALQPALENVGYDRSSILDLDSEMRRYVEVASIHRIREHERMLPSKEIGLGLRRVVELEDREVVPFVVCRHVAGAEAEEGTIGEHERGGERVVEGHDEERRQRLEHEHHEEYQWHEEERIHEAEQDAERHEAQVHDGIVAQHRSPEMPSRHVVDPEQALVRMGSKVLLQQWAIPRCQRLDRERDIGGGGGSSRLSHTVGFIGIDEGTELGRVSAIEIECQGRRRERSIHVGRHQGRAIGRHESHASGGLVVALEFEESTLEVVDVDRRWEIDRFQTIRATSRGDSRRHVRPWNGGRVDRAAQCTHISQQDQSKGTTTRRHLNLSRPGIILEPPMNVKESLVGQDAHGFLSRSCE